MKKNEKKEDFLGALQAFVKERGIPMEDIIKSLEKALSLAYKKEYNVEAAELCVDIERTPARIYLRKKVVEVVKTPSVEISLDKAREIDKRVGLDDYVKVEMVDTQNFGRVAAQNARQVIIQELRSAEGDKIYKKFASREQEVLWTVLTHKHPDSGDMTLRLGGEGTEGTNVWLPKSEQLPGDYDAFEVGDQVLVCVKEVRRTARRSSICVSRTHPNLVQYLFEIEVPEIKEGLVEIRAIAREAGDRTKLAVYATEENIDPVGACVGARSSRVAAVVNALRGEKMDIVVWSEDVCTFVASALAPADVISVTNTPGTKECRVIVPDDQLSLAIGKAGQNARLAANLTKCKIDIKPESQANAVAEEPASQQEELSVEE
ncbi:MAG: transcription termination/antitermination protein NusA [Oscillospiraceae bacterium]|nr:transcription termination/antitermination protein NusA [Oscillospiraceae bacterium]